MTSLLLSTPVSSDEYNSIPIYSDVSSLNETPELAQQIPLLTRLGEIIIRHGVETHWGVHVLHRHFVIPPSTAVIYDVVDPSLDLCNVVPASEAETARPRAYLLNNQGHFQPYEFEVGGEDVTTPPTEAFLQEFSRFLLENKLKDVIALSKEREEIKGRFREEYLFNGQSTLSLRRINHEEPAVISTLPDAFYGTSGWCFSRAVAEQALASDSILATATTSEGIPFVVHTVASHIHKELSLGRPEKVIKLAQDSVPCTLENARKVVAAGI